MNCQYGCPSENPDEICTRCGHQKVNHSTIHPHRCDGVYDKDHIHVVEVCHCTGFTTEPINVGTGI